MYDVDKLYDLVTNWMESNGFEQQRDNEWVNGEVSVFTQNYGEWFIGDDASEFILEIYHHQTHIDLYVEEDELGDFEVFKDVVDPNIILTLKHIYKNRRVKALEIPEGEFRVTTTETAFEYFENLLSQLVSL